MNIYEETKFIMKKYGINANKSLGQNFLIDDEVVSKIVERANITNEDLVIEIGPGLGTLTNELLKKAKKVIVVELDERMIKILKDRFSLYDNIEIINQDILKVNLNDIISKEKKEIGIKNAKVVANLPYYITTPIIFKLLQESKRITDITVMVQKEVAERMVAKPKTKSYGILTIMVDYLSDANIEIIVPNTSFIPSPDVTSAVIKLVKNKKYDVKNEELFFKLIHSAFAQRRKKLSNSLESTHFMDMNKSEIEELLIKNNINLNVRAEELNINEYINIINNL